MSQAEMNGHQLIVEERQRQIESEGFTATHDDQAGEATLEMAALSYRDAPGPEAVQPKQWPYSADWWKPSDRQRNLARAGALYQAAADAAERAGDYARRDALKDQVYSCGLLLDSHQSKA